MSQPNFILFMTDQQRADYLGCYGHQVLRTPAIDRMAERGTRFERCYVASPSCMPNRASLLTCRMPTVHGVRSNGIPLSLQSNTFVELLRANGYQTGLVGKSHLQNMYVEPPILPPGTSNHRRGLFDQDPLAEAVRRDAGAYDQELPLRWEADAGTPLKLPFYGFQFAKLCIGHGDTVTGHYLQWLRKRRPDAENLRGPENSLSHNYILPNAWRTAVPEELYPTHYIGLMAQQFLVEHAASGDSNTPYFLLVSFPDPHHPFTPPGRYWEMYDPHDMKLPLSFGKRANSLPQVKSAHQQRQSGVADPNSYGLFAVNEREAREAMALTCGMITMIDDAIASIIECCNSLGFGDNTVMAFTSDHGDLLGDHGLLRKGPAHFQSLVRVPLIWSDPHHPKCAEVREDLCSTIDIGSTILQRAGIEPYNGVQGTSLFTRNNDPRTPIESVLIEDEWQSAGMGFNYGPRSRTLITERHRLTIYDGFDQGELFDLRTDPDELVNLWSEEAAREVKSELMTKLAYRQMGIADRSPLPVSLA